MGGGTDDKTKADSVNATNDNNFSGLERSSMALGASRKHSDFFKIDAEDLRHMEDGKSQQSHPTPIRVKRLVRSAMFLASRSLTGISLLSQSGDVFHLILTFG